MLRDMSIAAPTYLRLFKSTILSFAVLLLAIAGAPRAAEPSIVDPKALASQLEAQFQAALIAERRLADDREARLIQDYESRLRAARQAAETGDDGAAVELAKVRAEYAELVAKVAINDLSLRAEVQRYRTEIEGVVAKASPERLAALQQFADGDRVGAWEVLDALREAESRAIEAAASARRAQLYVDDAYLREVMLQRGEATLDDVAALWERAAQLDDANFFAQSRTGDCFVDLGRFEDAKFYYERALAAATDDLYRVWTFIDLGNWAAARGDWASAGDYFQKAYGLLGPVLQTDGDKDPLVDWLAFYLGVSMANTAPLNSDSQSVIRFQIFLGHLIEQDISAAAARLLVEQLPKVNVTNEQLDVLEGVSYGILERQVAQADRYPDDLALQQSAITAALLYGNILIMRGRFVEAEELGRAVVEFASENLPPPLELNDLMATCVALLADAHIASGKYVEAKMGYDLVLHSMQKVAELDPSNLTNRRNVSIMLQRVGAVALLSKDFAGARTAWQSSLDGFQGLLADDSGNQVLQFDVVITNMLLTLLPAG